MDIATAAIDIDVFFLSFNKKYAVYSEFSFYGAIDYNFTLIY